MISNIKIFFRHLTCRFQRLHFLFKILAGFFSACTLLGNSYAHTDSWNLVFADLRHLLISVAAFIGYFLLFSLLFIVLNEILNKIKLNNITMRKSKPLRLFIDFIEKKPFLSSLFIILLFWLIYIIAFYPVILSPDPSYQIMQFFNIPTKYSNWVIQLDPDVYLTNHHPVLHTLLLGGCIKLGRFLLNDNFGLFIYSFIQIMVFASVLAYSIKYLKKLQISNKIRLMVLMIYSLVPMFPFYAMSGVKDTLYTSFIILYVILLLDFVKFYRGKKLPFSCIVYSIVLLLLISLFRNNGIYVVLLSFPFLIFSGRKNKARILLIVMVVFSVFSCYSKILLPHFKISPGSIREALSIPFQQTARYVKYHSEELSDEEIEIIDQLLGYETLARRYDPELSDPIKNGYNRYATTKDLKDYFKVWLRGLLKHPDTYLQATFNNIYGYFHPSTIEWYLYFDYDSRITKDDLVDYHYNDFSGLREVLSKWGLVFPHLQVIGLLSNIGFNTWLLMFIGTYFATHKKRQFLIPLLPLYISVLICIASPANTYFRYAMPYIFTMPFIVSAFVKEGSEENEP